MQSESFHWLSHHGHDPLHHTKQIGKRMRDLSVGLFYFCFSLVFYFGENLK